MQGAHTCIILHAYQEYHLDHDARKRSRDSVPGQAENQNYFSFSNLPLKLSYSPAGRKHKPFGVVQPLLATPLATPPASPALLPGMQS
jgi:hypothetical protein